MIAAALVALVQASPEASFAGRWMTNYGPMELTEKNKAVAGSYGWEPESELDGKRAGDELEFEWNAPWGRGTGTFSLWKDGRTFSGECAPAGGDKSFWGGYRIERKKAAPVPGEISDGQTELHLEYHLRVPKDYDPKKKYTALALFHGSNTSSRGYVEGFPGNWPELAERFVLVGFDGENLSPGSRDGTRAFNSSYVNFSGDRVGEPWRYMQTPALVADALRELSRELPIERWFVGGHSQGAFLTFAVAMFYPELVAGAFPVAGGLLVQCEPTAFGDEKVRAAQRRLPIAIVHGEKDSVVEFSMSRYSCDSFLDAGFPMVRLFTDFRAGHPWAFLPVDQAITWLERMTTSDPAALLTLARDSAEVERYRDACAALARLTGLGPSDEIAQQAAALSAEIDAAAAPELTRLEKLLAADKNNSWVDPFWDFRAEFGLTPAAKSLLATYDELRAKHQRAADALFYKARGESDEKKKKKLYREIVEEHYASSWYRLVKGWI